jgi:hypothetical protein
VRNLFFYGKLFWRFFMWVLFLSGFFFGRGEEKILISCPLLRIQADSKGAGLISYSLGRRPTTKAGPGFDPC